MPLRAASVLMRARSARGTRIDTAWVLPRCGEYAARIAAVIRSGLASQKSASSFSDLNSGRSMTIVFAGRFELRARLPFNFGFVIYFPLAAVHRERGNHARQHAALRVNNSEITPCAVRPKQTGRISPLRF